MSFDLSKSVTCAIGEYLALAELLKKGHEAFIAQGPTQKGWDVAIIKKNGESERVIRVQVKTIDWPKNNRRTVTGASGYVAGAFLSTAAISGLLVTASATLGAGALYLSGVAASIVGSAGIFGTTIGATGITGVLMSAGIISSTPVWVPLATGGAALGCGYGGYSLFPSSYLYQQHFSLFLCP